MKTNRKLAIFEFGYHIQFVKVVISLFTDSSITLYTTDDFWTKFSNQLRPLNIDTIVKGRNESHMRFLRKNKPAIDNTDLLFITTAGDSLRAIAQLEFRSRVILNIHNLNRWVDYKNNLQTLQEYRVNNTFVSFRTLRYCKNVIWEIINQRYRANILERIQYINVLHPNMIAKVLHSECVPKHCVVTNLPFKWCADAPEHSARDSSRLAVGIPGGISQNRRDYLGLLKSLEDFTFHHRKPIIVYLLGSFREQHLKKLVLSYVKNLRHPQIQVIVPDNRQYLNEARFSAALQRVDIILGPIQPFNTGSVCRERYGYTKATGVDFDALCYGKPIIMPKGYIPIDYMCSFYDFYDSYADLNTILDRYLDSKELNAKSSLIEDCYKHDPFKFITKQFMDAVLE